MKEPWVPSESSIKSRGEQVRKLNELKASRDSAEVARCLAAITEAMKDPANGNLLELAIAAARAHM